MNAWRSTRAAVQRRVEPGADAPDPPFRDRAGCVGAAGAVNRIRSVRRTLGCMRRAGVGEPGQEVGAVAMRGLHFRGRTPAQTARRLPVTATQHPLRVVRAGIEPCDRIDPKRREANAGSLHGVPHRLRKTPCTAARTRQGKQCEDRRDAPVSRYFVSPTGTARPGSRAGAANPTRAAQRARP